MKETKDDGFKKVAQCSGNESSSEKLHLKKLLCNSDKSTRIKFCLIDEEEVEQYSCITSISDLEKQDGQTTLDLGKGAKLIIDDFELT